MIVTFFSDTHGKHGLGVLGQYVPFGGTDVAVFTGDMSMRGTKHEVADFIEWYSKMPVQHKLLIAGNHDFFWEKADEIAIKEMLADKGLIYLNDSGVTIDYVKFWGSPITPWFHSWAFNRLPGDEIQKHWDLIPNDVDILMTHGPAYGLRDQVVNHRSSDDGRHVGCRQLLSKIKQVKPQVHCFGHIHEGYGVSLEDGTAFVNASVMDEDYNPINKPITIEIFGDVKD